MAVPIEIGSYEDFVEFFFGGRAVACLNAEEGCNVQCDPARLAEYYQRLFRQPRQSLQRFSREEIDRGFQHMINCNVPVGVIDVIWSDSVPVQQREQVIRAMASLYGELFDDDPLFGTPFMWWDPIASEFIRRGQRPADSPVVRRLFDASFETLVEILGLSSLESQKAALHGLNHLQHEGTPAVIDEYVRTHPDLPPEQRQFARLAALGMLP